MTKLVVVPCSRHYNRDGTRPCAVGRSRCDTASNRISLAQVTRYYQSVHVGLGAGREVSLQSGLTLAECSYEYMHRSCSDVGYIVNRQDHWVMTTLREVRWVVNQAQKELGGDLHFWFVTSPRHDRRLRLILRWFFPEVDAQVFTSEDPPIPWRVEILGYMKLWAVRICGEDRVERLVYAVRRPHYRD